jgi:hypothetical protein
MDILEKFDLKDWWIQSLSTNQRNQITNGYSPMGLPVSETPFLYQSVDKTPFSDSFGKLSLLLTLSHVAESPAKEILKAKAESELTKSNTTANINLIDIHLALASLIQHHYSLRADNKHYEKAKELCLIQISLASKVAKKFKHPEKPKELKRLHKITGFRHPYYDEPQMLPSHTGYKQLAIILEKVGDIKGTIKLSKQALKQGWTDYYEKRIERLNKKLTRQ